jgi:hypothetical protein
MRALAAVTAAMIAIPALAFAHAGGLDKNGCHNNKKKGAYECHQGALKDQSFKSQTEAEKALGTGTSGTSKRQGQPPAAAAKP